MLKLKGVFMNKHWTERSIQDFQYRIAADFVSQLEQQLESLPISQAELANRLNVTESRVSQILNNPSNLTLSSIIKYARALGLKVSIVAYNDNDPDNTRGVINSEIFTICWEKQGKPTDFFELEEATTDFNNVSSSEAFATEPIINPEIDDTNAYLMQGVSTIPKLTNSDNQAEKTPVVLTAAA
jgi:transcriptional regulator with XRE-family HTH domain